MVLQFLSLRKRKEKKQKKKDLEAQEEVFYGYLIVPYDKLLNDPVKKLCNSLNIGFLNKRKEILEISSLLKDLLPTY